LAIEFEFIYSPYNSPPPLLSLIKGQLSLPLSILSVDLIRSIRLAPSHPDIKSNACASPHTKGRKRNWWIGFNGIPRRNGAIQIVNEWSNSPHSHKRAAANAFTLYAQRAPSPDDTTTTRRLLPDHWTDSMVK
jgi:hypothetical protein